MNKPIFPVLPSEWAEDKVRGLRAYGGLRWTKAFADNRLVRVKVTRVTPLRSDHDP